MTACTRRHPVRRRCDDGEELCDGRGFVSAEKASPWTGAGGAPTRADIKRKHEAVTVSCVVSESKHDRVLV